MEKRTVPVKNPDIVDRVEQKEALLFDPASGNMMCLNSTGVFIWKKCDGNNTIEDISSDISREYEVALSEAEKDCQSFLGKLENKGFVGYRV